MSSEFEDEEPIDMEDGMFNPDSIDEDEMIIPETIKTTNKQQKENIITAGDEIKKLEMNLFLLQKLNLAPAKEKIDNLLKKINSPVPVKIEDSNENKNLNIKHDTNKNIIVIDEDTIKYINDYIADLLKNNDFTFIDKLNGIILKLEKMLEDNEKIIQHKNKTEMLDFQKEIKGIELLLKDVAEIKSDSKKSLNILSMPPKKNEPEIVYENENSSTLKTVMYAILIVFVLLSSMFIGLEQTVKNNGSVSILGLTIQEDYSHNNFIKR